ncbi:MAG: hypothetical protein WCL27_13100, partial [Betaproteobacteria bacterium]
GSAYQVVNAVGGFSMDGVIGWGRWSTGSCSTCNDGSQGTLENFHYVAGIQTSSADMTALGGLKADYALAGFTLPTSTGGIVGGRPSGTFSADFLNSSVQLKLDVPINAGRVTFDASGSISGSTFNGSGVTGEGFTGTFYGLFAGPKASYAGMGYKMPGGAVVSGDVMGVVVFKQTSTSPSVFVSPP